MKRAWRKRKPGSVRAPLAVAVAVDEDDGLHPGELPGGQRRPEAPHLKGVELRVRKSAVAVGVARGKDAPQGLDAQGAKRPRAPGSSGVEQGRSRVHHCLERVVKHLAHKHQPASRALQAGLDPSVGPHHGHHRGLQVLRGAGQVRLAADEDDGRGDPEAGEVGHPAGADALEGVVAA